MLARRTSGLPPAAINFAKKGINMAAESSVYAAQMFEQAQSCYGLNSKDKQEELPPSSKNVNQCTLASSTQSE